MIRFACPICKQHYSAAADAAGRKMACASCGRRVEIPASPGPQPSAAVPIPAHRPAADRTPYFVAAAAAAVICLKLLTVLAIILILCVRLSIFLRLFTR